MNKRDELCMQIAGEEPDIIIITEVIPKAQILPLSPALLAIPGYNVHTNFDPMQPHLGSCGRRGLCIYLKEGLIASCVEPVRGAVVSFEHLWIRVDLPGSDQLLIGGIYLSPSGDRLQSMLQLSELLKSVCQSKPSHLLVAGDFNVPQIDWVNVFSAEPEGHYSHCLINCIQDCFLTQHVTKPTRYRHGQSPSTLDLLLTNEEGMIKNLKYMHGLGSSDHIILRFSLAYQTERRGPPPVSHNFNKGDYELLRLTLGEVDWSMMHDSDVPQAYSLFKNTLQEAIDKCIPKTGPKPRKNLYVTKEVMKLKRRKKSLWNKYIRSSDPLDYAQYCTCRNKLRKLTRKLRTEFEQRISRELKTNPKVFWKYTNSRLKTKSGIEDLKDGRGHLCTDDLGKATMLNSFFSSVFTKEDTDSVPVLPAHEGPTLENINITEDMVRKKLSNLKTSCAPGPDGIHPRVLKEAAVQLALPLSILFQKSIDSGVLPDDWKVGTVVPIFKKGCRSEPGNYRPVSLTAIPCKVFESLIRDCLMTHLSEQEILYDDQHGFRPRRSCSSQLLEVLEEWSDIIERGDAVDALYLDFRKAFDSVPHQRLLTKLESLGVTGNLKRWIASFLQGRQQQVTVRGCSSPWAPVTSGVPQGTVLGPILFILYVNDLPDVCESSIKIFADDTKIYRSVSASTGYIELQRDLDAVVLWADKWQLPFSSTKCKSLHIGPRNPCHTYRMADTLLEQTHTEKDLGIHLDSELKFRKQAAAAAAKGNQLLALIKRSFMCIDTTTLPLLYKTLVRPHLEYGNLIWGPFNRADQKLIERVQRRATRLVQDIRHLPYEERLERLRLPSLHYRRRRGDMIALYQILTGGLDVRPEKFVELAPGPGTRGHTMKLRKPQAQSRVKRNTLPVRAINDWNSLPPSVVLAPSVNLFKARLDEHWYRITHTIPD